MKRSEYDRPEILLIRTSGDDLMTESQPYALEPKWELTL